MNPSKYILNTCLYTYRLLQIPVLTREFFSQWAVVNTEEDKVQRLSDYGMLSLKWESVLHTFLKTWGEGNHRRKRRKFVRARVREDVCEIAPTTPQQPVVTWTRSQKGRACKHIRMEERKVNEDRLSPRAS